MGTKVKTVQRFLESFGHTSVNHDWLMVALNTIVTNAYPPKRPPKSPRPKLVPWPYSPEYLKWRIRLNRYGTFGSKISGIVWMENTYTNDN